MAVLKYKNPNWDGTTASEEYLTLTVSGGGTSFDDAPSDNNSYVRSNGSWVFNYDTYTYDGDYPSGSANIYGVNYTFKVGDIAESTNKGLIVRYNNEWFKLGIIKEFKFSYSGNTSEANQYVTYNMNPSDAGIGFNGLWGVNSLQNLRIDDIIISKTESLQSKQETTSEDNLTKTQKIEKWTKAYSYASSPTVWEVRQTTIKTYTRATTDEDFVDSGNDAITYSGYKRVYVNRDNLYYVINTASTDALVAKSKANSAYSLADSLKSKVTALETTKETLQGTCNTQTITTTSTNLSITLKDYTLIFLTTSGSSITLSYDYTNNPYINSYTVLIKNTNSSEINFSLTKNSADTILGEMPSTIAASGGIIELNFLRDKSSSCFYIRGIS